jgi:hypothetical protein
MLKKSRNLMEDAPASLFAWCQHGLQTRVTDADLRVTRIGLFFPKEPVDRYQFR